MLLWHSGADSERNRSIGQRGRRIPEDSAEPRQSIHLQGRQQCAGRFGGDVHGLQPRPETAVCPVHGEGDDGRESAAGSRPTEGLRRRVAAGEHRQADEGGSADAGNAQDAGGGLG